MWQEEGEVLLGQICVTAFINCSLANYRERWKNRKYKRKKKKERYSGDLKNVLARYSDYGDVDESEG